jgi:trimethylamine--corrinoid protein Co-methyltransferase
MIFFELLSKDQIEQVHEASLYIMAQIGLDFLYSPALEVLSKGGVRVEGNRAFFPRTIVEEQIQKSPSQFTLYGRNSNNNLIIGGDHITFVPTNCPPFVTDLDNGRREGTLKDFENFVKLTQASPNLDMCSNIFVEPMDVLPEKRHVQMAYSCIKYSDKCFMGSVMGVKGARDTLAMLSILFGDLRTLTQKPRIISVPCSLTPLCYDETMLGALMEYAKAGQPQLINSLVIAGATGPVTLAGTLAVQNAEILAGIVLTQLVREGTPVVYASGSSNADMRSGLLCVGSPEMAMNNVFAAQMARYYGLPSRGVGALCDAKIPDAQAGYESMMNLLMAQNSGINFVLHAAGALESMNCISYEKFIIDDETIGMVKRIRKGIELDKSTFALDVVKEVGPRGHFLDKDHTFNYFRSELYQPYLSDRRSFEDWRDRGATQCMVTANKIWRETLKKYQPPDIPKSVDKDLKMFIDTA